MKDTLTKNTMNILLLNIPFAVLGVSIAVVPLLIGINRQSKTKPNAVVVTRAEVFPVHEKEDRNDEEYDLAA